MKRALIVGQKISTVVTYLEENGWDFIVLKDVKRTKFPDKRFKRRVLCDFSSPATVETALSTIKVPIDIVLVTYENYILPASWICKMLDLPGLSTTAAEACTDKFKMRSLFAKAPEKISPDFALANTVEDVRKFASEHEFPLILKPANLAKSLLVTKNDDLAELEANFTKAQSSIGTIYKQYAPDRTPQLLIEEFMEGSIHSVDAFVDAEGTPDVLENIVDYQTGYDVGYEDNFHYSRILPSKLSHSDQTAIRHCAEVGIRALGMSSSPAHVEIILTKDGPRIVEIGARNGGYRDRMHELANGIDITGAAMALTERKRPNIKAVKNDYCAVLEIFPKQTGVFKEITNLDKLRALPSIHSVMVKAKPGAPVGKASEGYKTPLIVILHSTDRQQFESDLRTIESDITIVCKD